MTGQAIPQDNRIAHDNMEQSKQAKYCFNLPNNAQILCFEKLTGEHNTEKILEKNFVLLEYTFNPDYTDCMIILIHAYYTMYMYI